MSDAKNYSMHFVDRILDNVHGFIELTAVERELIGLPLFTRLQGIKQLSLVNRVFPGAEHTRYTHSLGVMHIADKMAIHLKFDNKDRQIIRLAGLLHDIGHYPFSHVIEDVYRTAYLPNEDHFQYQKRKVKENIEKLEKLTTFEKFFDDLSCTAIFHHEQVGAEIIQNNKEIKEIIQKHCEFADINDLISEICAIITGLYSEHYEMAHKIQLLHSELDADRMDYLLRDAAFSGTYYGVFDLGIIIKNLKLVKPPVELGVNEFPKILGIKPKGISATDQFIINRFFSWTQVLSNRHVAALEFMLKAVMQAIAGKNGLPSLGGKEGGMKDLVKPDQIERFLSFNELVFWHRVQDIQREAVALGPEEQYKKINEIVNKLLKHQEIKGTRKTIPTSSGPKEREIIEEAVISDELQKVKETLKESKIYENLIANKENRIPFLHKVPLTRHLPHKEFEEGINTKFRHADERVKYKLLRLLDGAVVIDEDESCKLLIDDPRSILSKIAMQKCIILREYDTSKTEQNILV